MAADGGSDSFACVRDSLIIEEAAELRQLISARASGQDADNRPADARIIQMVSCSTTAHRLQRIRTFSTALCCVPLHDA